MRRIVLTIVVLLYYSMANANTQTDHLKAILALNNTGGCDSCTSGLVFSAYFESDTTITNGSPCGCIDNSGFQDATGTLAGDATITGGYVNCPNASDYIEFDVASVPQDGSVLVEFEIVYATNEQVFRINVDADDWLEVSMKSSADMSAEWSGQGATVQALALAGQVADNTRLWMVVRWTDNDVDPNVRVEIYNTSETLLDSAQNSTNTTTMGSSSGTISIGNNDTPTGVVRIYTFKIWDTYAGAPTSGF